jgi:hypothetical protein
MTEDAAVRVARLPASSEVTFHMNEQPALGACDVAVMSPNHVSWQETYAVHMCTALCSRRRSEFINRWCSVSGFFFLIFTVIPVV